MLRMTSCAMSIAFPAFMLLCLLSFVDGTRLFKRQTDNNSVAIVPDTSSPTTPAPLPPAPTAAPARNPLLSDFSFPGFGTGGGGGARFPSFSFDFDPFSPSSGGPAKASFPTFNNRNPGRNFPSFNNVNTFPTPPPFTRGSANPNTPSSNAPANTNFPTYDNRNLAFPQYGNNFDDDSDFTFDSSPFSFNSFPSFSNRQPAVSRNPTFPQFGNSPPRQNGGVPNFPTPRPRQRFPSRLPGPPLQVASPPTPVTVPNPTASVCYPPVDLPLGIDRVSNETIPDRIFQLMNTSLETDERTSVILDTLAAANNPSPNLYPLPESSEYSCPADAYIATKFTRFGSDCWILNIKQQPFFFVKCQCHQCLHETGSAGSCQAFSVPLALFAWCENNGELTVEMVHIPVTCRCRYNTPAVTQLPLQPPDSSTLSPPSAAPSPSVPGGATEAPPVSTEAPPVSTEAPPVSTEAPPVSTEAPPVSTEARPVSTEAPPVSTEAPPVATTST